MLRKVIKQGHNTMTVTLPSEWVKRFNLTGGSQIKMTERDNGLFLTTEKNDYSKKTALDISNLDIPSIWKYFMAIYREGYDEVVVKFKEGQVFESPYKFFVQHKLDMKHGRKAQKKSAVEFIQELVSRFIGWEIIDYEKDCLTIKEMTEPTSKEFDNSLRRVLLLIQDMANETVLAVKNKNGKVLSNLHDVDINVDKFHDYCVRILNKVGNKDTRKTSLLFTVLFFLELIGDEFKSISHHLVWDYPSVDLKEIEGILESVKKRIDLYYDLFYKFDEKKVMLMSNFDQEMYFSTTKNKIKKPEAQELFHHIRLINRYLNSLLELRIEMEY